MSRERPLNMTEYICKQDAVDEIHEFPMFMECNEIYIYQKRIEKIPAADVVPVNREKLMAVLRDYFSIGDSYTYELTRVKSAFGIGTMSLDDFAEWEEEDISCLCDYILRELRRGNKGG